jgi:phosphatidylglycerophosphatase A
MQPGQFLDKIAIFISTGLGLGLLPVMPGTYGSFLGLFLAWGIWDQSLAVRLGLFLGCSFVSIITTQRADAFWKTRDNPRIVIDEVLGMWLTVWFFEPHWLNWSLAFFLFRFFDIIKPPPVNYIDKSSQYLKNPWSSAFAVLLDDLVAALQAIAILFAINLLK